MKSFIKYPGGKSRELDIIHANMPPDIKRYFEPFVGGGSVFFDLNVQQSHINDISEDLISLYRLIQKKDPAFLLTLSRLNNDWKELDPSNWENIDFSYMSSDPHIVNVYKKHKIAEEKRRMDKAKRCADDEGIEYDTSTILITSVKAAFYCTVRHIYNTERRSTAPNKLNKAVAYYFIREFCYSSMFRFSSAGDFNVPYGGLSYNSKNFDQKIDLINQYDIETVGIYNEDYKAFLSRFEFNDTDFIFVDPPYDSEFSEYDGNSFDANAQRELVEVLSCLPARIMIVVKNTDFIYDLYNQKGFHIKSFDKRYAVNFRNRNSRDVKHLLITNY